MSTHCPVLDLPSQFRKALSWGAYITLVIAPGSTRSRTLLLYKSLLTLILLPIGITLPQSIIIFQQANAGGWTIRQSFPASLLRSIALT